MRVCSPDERRFGLLTIRRRRLPARGVPPIGTVHPGFGWGSVDGAVEPTTGERFFLAWPYLHAEMFQRCVDAFAQAFPASRNILVLDTSGAHTSAHLTLPQNVRLRFLPPYCPAWNPIERVWRALQDDVAWLQFADLDAPQDDLTLLLQDYAAATLQSLTGYPALVEAMHARQA